MEEVNERSDHQLTHKLDLSNSEAPHPLPFPWNAHCSHSRRHFKGTALRRYCVTETIWTVYVMHLIKASMDS